MKHKLTAAIMSGITLFLCCACSYEPEDTLDQLAFAINTYDLDGIVACFEPSVQNTYEIIMQATSWITFDDRKKLQQLLSIGGTLSYFAVNELFSDNPPQVSIVVNSKETRSSEKVTLHSTIYYTYPNKPLDQSALSMNADFDLALFDGEWKIVLFPDHFSGNQEEYIFLDQPVTTESNISAIPMSETVPNIQETEMQTDPPTDPPTEPETILQDLEDDIYQQLVAECNQYHNPIIIPKKMQKEEIQNVIRRLQAEHPEFFWLNDYMATYGSEKTEIEFHLPSGIASADLPGMAEQIENEAQSVIRQIPEGISDYDKILFVHDYLITHTDYDQEGAQATIPGISHTAYGCLINHNAVCLGYSKAFQMIMQKLGFDCGICSGDANGSHAWNYIFLNGNYYWIDVTWDDPVCQNASDISSLSHSYFLINDEILFRSRTLEDKNYFVPVCNSLEENYFVKNQSYLTEYSLAQISDIIQKNADHHQAEIMFSSPEAYQQARYELFENNAIFEIDVIKEKGTMYYSAEDDVYLLIICF